MGTPFDSRATTVLRSAVSLLAQADRALSGGSDDARKFIERAAALLQAESDSIARVTHSAPTALRSGLAPWQLARVERFIDANLGRKIGPQDFAGLLSLSAGYFTRAFRATVGEAPHAFLTRRRIERAKQLMLESDLPLVQIALECGFADQTHLTRLFTRIVGISPGAWRRAHVAPFETREQPPSSALEFTPAQRPRSNWFVHTNQVQPDSARSTVTWGAPSG